MYRPPTGTFMRLATVLRHAILSALLVVHLPGAQAQQKSATSSTGRATPAAPRSAPLANIRYDLTFDSTTASRRAIEVAMSFDVTAPGPVLLSLPSWTPGAYEIGNFARWVVGFAPTAGDSALTWDKLDYDTWRV